MGFLKVLARPRIAILWVSQVLSAMGDYLYSLAVIWIAVKAVGSEASVVAAAQASSQLVFGLLGGVYADRWDRRKVMVLVDIVRAGAVALLALLATLGMLQFWELVAGAVVIGSLGSLFDPALQASLPALAGDARTLQATNGLMDITSRVARALGPSMAGLLILFLPLSQFFTLDAISFVISALAILSLGRHIVWKAQSSLQKQVGLRGIWYEISGAVRLVGQHKLLAWTLLLNGLMNLAWSAGFLIGVPLLADRVLKGNIGVYGLIVGAYGVGNVISNLILGSIALQRRGVMIFCGKIIVGLGFIIIACAHSPAIAIIGSALAALGGPMGDITMLNIMQIDLPLSSLGKVYSLRMMLANIGSSLGLFLAFPLFAHVSIMFGILLCAFTMIALGLVGFMRFGFQDPPSVSTPAEQGIVTLIHDPIDAQSKK
ncbi:MFS transporter [Dictyobacter arantiisoli]|uniref:Major facilitator superfamily (MFS) profile domain-containing protein n=1 Tax=Dictyobacter arantiisoli TaxID=2014874 RepID=A0A5A5TFH0_9CHLR|nr:MFS transporter [Dictyobacter arantiisoli]GCF10320.1 hypothetical protein KDI_38840 [Dictyobacter arantiisoli]